jgi:hypothetical protein
VKLSKRERAAIAEGVRSGKIKPGATIRRCNPGDLMAEEFEKFHWGRKAKRKKRHRVKQHREVYELGRVREIGYETKKGGENAIWVHQFERPYPTLTATEDGKLGPIVGGGYRVTPRGIEG